MADQGKRDLARHTGQVDIMREQHDVAIGLQRENTNIPNDYDWPAYVAKLAERADRSRQPAAPNSSEGHRVFGRDIEGTSRACTTSPPPASNRGRHHLVQLRPGDHSK